MILKKEIKTKRRSIQSIQKNICNNVPLNQLFYQLFYRLRSNIYAATIILHQLLYSFLFLLSRITLFKFSLPTSLGKKPCIPLHPPEEGRLGRFNVRFSEDGGRLNRVERRSLLRKAVRMEATINREMAGSSSRIYTPPSAVLSSVALDPVILPPCFDSASFRRDCSLSWITLTSGMDLGFMIWDRKPVLQIWDLFQRFYFETDAIVHSVFNSES